MVKKILLLALTLACLSALSGCNTMYGFGQDLEAAGEGIQNAAAH